MGGRLFFSILRDVVISTYRKAPPRFSPCLSPSWVVAIHQLVETGVVAGFQQVTQFMNHHMLHAPFWQQQQVQGEAYRAVLYVTLSPPRYSSLIIKPCRAHTHYLRVLFHHRLHHCFQPRKGFAGLLASGQWQLVIEVRPLLLFFCSTLSGLLYPVAMLRDEVLHPTLRQTYRCRHMNVAILHYPHRQPASPSVCHLYVHAAKSALDYTASE